MNLPDCYITQRVRENSPFPLLPARTGTIVGFTLDDEGPRRPIVLFDGEQTGAWMHQAHLMPLADSP